MSPMQCWGLHADGQSRCPGSALSISFFCAGHRRPEGPRPAEIFCLPEADMPPELVEQIRECCPDFVFPAPPGSERLDLPVCPPAAPSAVAIELPTRSENAAAAPSPEATDDEEPLAWLLAAVREAVEEVRASEAKPLAKANAVARLGNLYLKTYGAAALRKENRALKQQARELEQQLAAAHAAAEAVAGLAEKHGASPPAVGVSEARAAAKSQLLPSTEAPRPEPTAAPAALPRGAPSGNEG
jgi:hypothetical protein